MTGAAMARPPRRHIRAEVLVRDSTGGVLLVRPHGEQHWTLPGTRVHAWEVIAHAAARALREAAGLEPPLTHLVALDQEPAGEDGASAEGIAVVVDGGAVTGEAAALARDPGAAEWVPARALAAHADPHQHHRIRAALHATAHANELPLLLLGAGAGAPRRGNGG